jgi:hypothetical protein
MPSAGFEPAIPATERPQTYALDCVATGIVVDYTLLNFNCYMLFCGKNALKQRTVYSSIAGCVGPTCVNVLTIRSIRN